MKNNDLIKRGSWMKQKYIIKKNDAKGTLAIKEYAELDKEIMSFMGEHGYKGEDITLAIAGGSHELVKVLRCHDFYPPQAVADRLSEKITEIYDAGIDDAVELLLNDVDFLAKAEPKEPVIVPEIEVHDDIVADDVDDLLEDKLDGDLVDSKKTSIKIAADETLDDDIDLDV
jgi:hypothetical protein